MSQSTKFGLSFAFSRGVPRNGFPLPPVSPIVPLWCPLIALGVGHCRGEFWPAVEDCSPGVGVARSRRKRWDTCSSSPGVAHALPCESPVVTRSVRLTPAWAFDPATFRLPLALESPAVAVGHIFRAHVERLGVPAVGRWCGTWPSFWLVP